MLPDRSEHFVERCVERQRPALSGELLVTLRSDGLLDAPVYRIIEQRGVEVLGVVADRPGPEGGPLEITGLGKEHHCRAQRGHGEMWRVECHGAVDHVCEVAAGGI